MTSKTTIAITLFAALSAPAVQAEWKGNEPCSGKEGVIGSCLNRISTRDREPATRAQDARSASRAPAPAGTTTVQGQRTAANVR